jgi:hypothetical protein
MGRGEKIPNIEHPTSNFEHRTKRQREDLFIPYFDVQCSMFNVRCSL